MNSSLYGKIEKAKRYQQEPERISLRNLELTFNGEHSAHNLTLAGDEWRCDCSSYPMYGTCSHIMAMQRILSPMLSPEARYGPEPFGTHHLDGEADGRIESAVVA